MHHHSSSSHHAPPLTPADAPPLIPGDDPTASALFDWSDFLDFNIDETLNVPFTHPPLPSPPPLPPHDPDQLQFDVAGVDIESQRAENPKVRKRDPMLVCPNFLAGRIPCACPELDAQMLEEEDSAMLPGKKRPRAARAAGGTPARCQVPGCEVDISELKGYHKRHRVCLKCANATVVALDGESKRYCQQCGKFHILPDFDEGKRSCRRKLERHNNRRRRKPPNDSKGGVDKESQQNIIADDISGDDDTGKDGTCLSSQNEERETLLESEGQIPTPCSIPISQNFQNDIAASLATSDVIHIDGDKQNSQFKRSPSYSENKSNYSSVCPTGRISFKLYDWNPAEFPRRLRHQIFQWLASMPVELEGYIRPGCTILTAFIAVPQPVWAKLLDEPALHIKDLVTSPGSMLSGRGTMLVYLNGMMFRIMKDATSVVEVKVKAQAPQLHYVYPTFFEAGKPMEFVVCGSNLLQPKFRLLVSVSGQYLAYKISVSSPCCTKQNTSSLNHQLLNIHVPLSDMYMCGPVFIEVENQSGLSNFIPILVGDNKICTEMEILQQKSETGLLPEEQQLCKCEFLATRQAQFSEFVLDVAWSLKKPVPEQKLTYFHVQRVNYLLSSLIKLESSIILGRVFCSLKSALDNNLVADVPDDEIKLLRQNMDIARIILDERLEEKDLSMMLLSKGSFQGQCLLNGNCSVVPIKEDPRTVKNAVVTQMLSSFVDEGATAPLLNGNGVMYQQQRPGKLISHRLRRTFLTSRPLIMAVAVIGVCFGICAVFLHPEKVGQIATTIRRCLISNS